MDAAAAGATFAWFSLPDALLTCLMMAAPGVVEVDGEGGVAVVATTSLMLASTLYATETTALVTA